MCPFRSITAKITKALQPTLSSSKQSQSKNVQDRKANLIPKSYEDLRNTVPPAWPLLDERASFPDMHLQGQSPLFSNLVFDVRAEIFREVLSDPNRLTHIVELKKNMSDRNMWRFDFVRCVEPDSDVNSWLHRSCYWNFTGDGYHLPTWLPQRHYRTISLLYTCRLV
jgi:hypothetical protein